MNRQALSKPVLAGLLAVLGVCFHGAVQAAGTPAQDAAAKEAQAAYDATPKPTTDVQDGGENGGGVVILNGQAIDANKLAPGVRKNKTDALQALGKQSGSLDALHTATTAQAAEDNQDSDIEGQAFVTAKRSAKPAEDARKTILQDNAFWANSLDAVNQAQAGNAAGTPVGSCTTTTTGVPIQTTSYTTQEQVCDVVQSPSNAPVCSRAFQWQTGTVTISQNQSGSVAVDTEVNGQVCERQVTVAGSTTVVDGSMSAPLTFPNETGGQVCSRTRWPTDQPAWVAKSLTTTVAVNKDVAGQMCERQRWVTRSTGVVPGTHAAPLALATGTSGAVCTRTRVPKATTTDGTAPGAKLMTASTFAAVTQGATLAIDMSPVTTNSGSDWQWPAAGTALTPGGADGELNVDQGVRGAVCSRTIVPVANNTTSPGSYAADLSVDTEYPHNLCKRTITPTQHTVQTPQSKPATLGVDTESTGQVCSRSRWPKASTKNVAGHLNTTLTTYPLGSDGILETLARWPTQAPGSAGKKTTAPVVQTRGAGLPYDPAGAHSGTITLDISSILPAGAPAISGFAIVPICSERNAGGGLLGNQPYTNIACNKGGTSMNMQMTVAQVPSAANHWIAIYNWKDLNAANVTFGFVSATATWTVPSFTSDIPGTVSATDGTANIYGGTGSVSLAGTIGSATTITNFTIDATCTATSPKGPFESFPCGQPNAVGKPVGFPVLYNVAITQAPTAANNWVAKFSFSTLSTCPLCGTGSMTYVAHWLDGQVLNTTFSVVTTPGTIQTGTTPPCTKAFTCSLNPPATINGVPVTAAMVSGLPLLYPGASTSCLKATEKQTCTAAKAVTATVDISASIPAGATSITGFAFTVSNPQAGVAVALKTAPTLANQWIATFTVTKSLWTADTVAPKLALTWLAQVADVVWSLKETGDCAATGTTNCPVKWSCAQLPPATVNGISVTGPMVTGLPALYPSAPTTCIVASLSDACTGNAVRTTTVSIADIVPVGTTTIATFTYVVSNPQTGVTVALVSKPTLANSWVATFTTKRTVWTAVPVQPKITLSWTVPTVVTDTAINEIGNCNDPGTTSCAAAWSCASKAPTVINGETITAAMAQALSPMYPSAPVSCVIGSLDATCAGTAVNTTTVNIAGQIPAGTTAITAFAFVVTNPQPGVRVNVTAKPSLANHWVATFTTTRLEWTKVPVAPHITMTWSNTIKGETASVVTTGDCSVSSATACTMTWSCASMAPTTHGGLPIDVAMANQFAPLYAGADYACAAASLKGTCSGAGPKITKMSIGALLPSGTKSVQDVAFTVSNPQTGVAIAITDQPTLANNWTITFTTTRTDWTIAPVDPKIHVTWNAGRPTVDFTIKSSGNITDKGTAACPVKWGCTQSAPATVNAIPVTAAMLASQPVLYPGASTTCLKADLDRTCTGPFVKSTSVSIAATIPAGTTVIDSFAFVVKNPQAGVTVALTQTPDLTNSWVAIFSVTRDASVTAPVKPSITMTWHVSTTTYSFSISDSGDCSTPGTSNCPVAWSCTTAPPATIAGIDVTTAMVAGQPPLFPGDTATCLVGLLTSSCSGSASTSTTVSIAADIPAGVTSITAVAFTVSNPQTGVTVAMTAPPTLANNWVGTFKVTQTVWASTLVAPKINITWNQSVETYAFSVVDTGNCAAKGDATCPVAWSCKTSAPATINGIDVTATMLNGQKALYPTAAITCVTGDLDATCTGTNQTTAPIDVSSKIVAGTTQIRNVTVTVNNPQPGVTVTLDTEPSLANNWIATVRITRSDFSYVPVRPSVKIGFEAQQDAVSFTMQDTGDCSLTGSAHCPTAWSCTGSAPTTINSIPVTVAEVKGLAALFPGAAPACVSGALNSICTGTDTVSTSVSIAGQILPGATAISAFNWVVSNPQTGLTVALTQTPALGNSWVAVFAVTRNYSKGSVVAPNLALSWKATVGTVTLGTADTGNCSATGTASCPLNWACKTPAPATISGANVTSTMLLSAGIRLYPADTGSLCVDATLNRDCSGSGTTTTTISIAAQIPPGTTVIKNFAWTVSTPVAGVTVALVSAPSVANAWVATFSTSRTDWITVPSGQPVVAMTWQVDTGSGLVLKPVDSGDCSITGDAFCSTQWMCTAYAGTVPVGGTSEQDIPGTVHESMTGSAAGRTVSVSIASSIPQGTTNLTGVAWVEGTGPGGGGGGSCGGGSVPGSLPCAVVKPMNAAGASATLVTLPSLANNWTATFTVYSRCTDGFCSTETGWLQWTAVIPGTPGSTGGSGITTGDLNGVPPIYPGAPTNCIAAQKVYQCSTINNGTVCHTTSTGEQVCDSVVGGAFDGCGALRADPTCSLARTVCTDDAMSSTGFCYIENEVFECKTPVTGSDTGVTSTTTCNMNLPVCTTAGCDQTYTETSTASQGSAAHAMAHLAMIEDINSDYVDNNVPGGTGGGGTGGGGTGGGGTGGGGRGGGGTGGGNQQQASRAGAGRTWTADVTTAAAGWSPWSDPSLGSNQSVSVPSSAGSITPPPGWNPAALSFFNGSEQSCMKVLGGLLNCCTKDPGAEGGQDWWQTFQQKLRSGWAGVASCSVAPTGVTPPPGGWSTLKPGASMQSVTQGFTSALENLTGNGVIPSCQTPGQQTMQTVEQSFEAKADATLIPKLAWYCDSSEKMLGVRKRLGECEYLGDYCKTSVLGFCLDKRQRYCCFNSPMTKMVREQLNTQGIVGFGTAKTPQCGGVSMAQMQQMNASAIDTSSLEGSMIEAGAVPSFSDLLNNQFLASFTGSGSAIGNAGRQDVATRTIGRVGSVQTTDAYNSISNQIDPLLPDPATVVQPVGGPGNITVQNATVNVTRGNFFDVNLTRSGGTGAVSIQVTDVAGTATASIDYAFPAPNPQTVAWGNGDTSTRKIRIYTYKPYPLVTTPRSFEIHLSNPTGGASLYPTGIQQITILPAAN